MAAPATITIDGGGSDIWGTADQCHFYYEQVSGAFDVTVRVDDIDNTSDWAKAGIMVREGLEPDAKSVLVRHTPEDESSVQWRPTTGSESESTTQSDIGNGTVDGDWIRLVRDGDALIGYGSTDGSDWTRICRLSSSRVNLSEDTYVGLAVSSFNRGTLCSAAFDELAGLSPNENRDLGNVNPAGSVSTRARREEPTETDAPDDGEPAETETTADGTSQFGLGSGFADPAPWLDDDVSVRTVTEPTRSAVDSAIGGSGPRVVVFETSGTVDLGGSPLKLTADNCWIAGQTAPSPGITFVNGRLQISGDNCIIQHVRSRIGSGSNGTIQGNDSVNTAYGTHNNVIDHVSASWGTDECMSVGYKTSETTFTNNLIYEGLYDPFDDQSEHHYATLVGDDADSVTLAGNVWAKCRRRMPRLKTGSKAVVANNLAYFFDGGSNMDGDTDASFVGNAYLGQIDTGDRVFEGGNAYMEDNAVAEPPLDSDTPKYSGNELDSRPLWPDGLDAMPSSNVEGHNLANAGARPADRTAHDERIIEEISDRAGNDELDSPYDYWVADEDDAGGFPNLPENTHSLNVPDSDLREWLEDWARAVEDPNASPP